MRQPFPPGPLWGCATSACQIEGSPLADGAGAVVRHDANAWPVPAVPHVHVDFATWQRTPKASARFNAEVIAAHGANL